MASCGTCKYYKALDQGDGACRRYPPTVISDPSFDTVQRWPRVKPTEYCGEWIQAS